MRTGLMYTNFASPSPNSCQFRLGVLGRLRLALQIKLGEKVTMTSGRFGCFHELLHDLNR